MALNRLININSKSNLLNNEYNKKNINEEFTFKNIYDKISKDVEHESGELKISKHASKRFIERGINLEKKQLYKLESAVETAKNKGVNDALIMMDELMFIVNTKNNTIVTATNQKENKVFTNIDGVVII